MFILSKNLSHPLEIISYGNTIIDALRVISKVNTKWNFKLHWDFSIEGNCLQTVIFNDIFCKMMINLLTIFTQSKDK